MSNDPESGEVSELQVRQQGGKDRSFAIVKDGDKTTYTNQEGKWVSQATVEGDDYSFSKTLVLDDEAKEMLKLQMMLQMGGLG